MKRSFLFLIAAGLVAIHAAAPEVHTAKPALLASDESIRLPARTAPAEQAGVYSRATGIVRERSVDIGDPVKAGQTLAVLDAPELEREIDAAQARLATAQARADLARRAFARAQAMSKERVIAAEALDQREAEARTSEAEVRAAVAEVARLQALEAFLTIRAPFDGVVASPRRIDRGDHIEGDQFAGAALFTIVRLDTLRIEIDAPPAAALRLAPGQVASVTFGELPGETFSAKVARSSGVIDNRSGTMRIELEMPNPANRLPAGLSGIAEIRLADTSAGRYSIPTNALLVRDGVPHVARLDDGRISFVRVSPGRNFGTSVEILEGVSASDELVISPNSLLREGDAVAVAKPPSPAGR